MIRVFLADDHNVVRSGLRLLLESSPELTVVGEAADGPAAIAGVRSVSPDVLVLDLMLPGIGGLDVAAALLAERSDTRIVILSVHADTAYVAAALRAGALGYVLKSAGAEELTAAVRAAAKGESYLGAPLSRDSVEQYERRAERAGGDALQLLTPRELEILYDVAAGQTSREIAFARAISHRTVEAHRGNILRKLGLRGQPELVRYALQRGLLPVYPEPDGSSPAT